MPIDSTIKDLKCVLNDNFEYPYNTLKLKVNDKKLNDKQPISDIELNAIVKLVFKHLQGGGFNCGNGCGLTCRFPCCIGQCGCC